jgi:hypothetical protein
MLTSSWMRVPNQRALKLARHSNINEAFPALRAASQHVFGSAPSIGILFQFGGLSSATGV